MNRCIENLKPGDIIYRSRNRNTFVCFESPSDGLRDLVYINEEGNKMHHCVCPSCYCIINEAITRIIKAPKTDLAASDSRNDIAPNIRAIKAL